MSPLRTVFWAAFATDLACGLGAIPFIWKKTLSRKWIGYANAIAAGLMIAASFDLIYHGININGTEGAAAPMVIGGMLIGLFFIILTGYITDRLSKKNGAQTEKLSLKSAFLMIVIMTIHSGAEGIAMGVAQGASVALGVFVFIVMALQNIPEGLAISVTLVPKGKPWWQAALRSIFTSLPQPLLAVPAFYFVHIFRPLVPRGLGFAAGCMLWMCYGGLLPESYEGTDRTRLGIITTVSVVVMLLLQIAVT